MIIKTTLAAGLAALALTSGATAQGTAPWQVQVHQDPMTDTVQVLVGTEGNGTLAGFACDRHDLRMFMVQTHIFDIELGDYRQVTWRVDSHEPVTQTWINNSNAGASIYDAEAVALARKVANAQERFVVRSGGETISFSIDGSTSTIAQAFERCGISLEIGSAANAASELADAMREN